MSNDEVGHLVARLSLNIEDFMSAMKKVQDEVHKTHKEIDSLGKRAKHFGKELGKDVANRLLGGLGFGGIAGGAAAGVVHLAEKTMEEVEKYEKAEIKLGAVLEVNKRNVAETTKEYENYANQLRQSSDMNYLQIKGLLTMAETYGLTGESAERATQQAADLAEVSGGSAEHMMRLTAMLEEGDIEGAMRFKRMIPQLRNVNNEMEMLVKLHELTEAGEKSRERNANSIGAIWHRTIDRMEKGLGIVGRFGFEHSPSLKILLKLFGLTGEPEPGVPQQSVKEQMALGGYTMIEKRVEKLKEEVKYAHLATQAEKDIAKAIDMGILSVSGGRAMLDTYKMYADYIEGTKAWLTGLKEIAGEYDSIAAKMAKLYMVGDAEKSAYDRAVKLAKFREEHPNEGFRADEMERENRNLNRMDRFFESARMLKEQERPEITFAREQEHILKLAKEFHWTQEQINRALETQRDKIFGVMAAAQAADSVFSAANAHRQFMDYYVDPRGRNMGSESTGENITYGSGGKGATGSIITAIRTMQDAITDPSSGVHLVFAPLGL